MVTLKFNIEIQEDGMRLYLCEKPSQGKDIGRLLGATQRGDGCLNGSGVTATWCIGHLLGGAVQTGGGS